MAFVVCVLQPFCEQSIMADVLYVSSAVSNEGDGSVSAPFKTIGKAAAMVYPGDTVLVSGGIYVEKNISPAHSGTKDSMIVFKANPNTGAVILHHPDTSYSNSDNKGVFHLNQTSFIWIEGFRFSDFKYGKTSIQITKGEGNVIVNNRFENLGNSEVAWDQVTPGVVIYVSRNNVVRNNYFNTIYGDGITVNANGSSGNLVRENTFKNFQGKERSWASAGALFSRSIDIQDNSNGNNVFMANLGTNNLRNFIWLDRNGSRNVVLRNKSYDGGSFIFNESRCTTNVVQENICYNMITGFETARYNTGWTEGARWISNIAFNNKTGFFCHKSGRDEFRNNIAFNNSDYNIVITDTALTQGPRIFSNNLWYTEDKTASMIYGSNGISISEWITRTGENGALSTNPLFVSTTKGAENFNLQQSSPCVKAGYNGVDMGAYACYPASRTGWDSTLIFSKTLVSFDSVISNAERGTQIYIGVNLSNAAKVNVSADIVPIAGDAQNGVDFQIENRSVTFYPGETYKKVSLTLTGSSEYEELVALSFSNTINAQPGARNIQIVKIKAGQTSTTTYYKVNATASAGGSISQNPTGSSLAQGTQVTFSVVPNTEWKFAGWSGDYTGTDSVYTISSLNSDVTLNASFIPVNPYLYEAEYAQLHDVTVISSSPGYSGTGYADFGGVGSYIELPVYVSESGEKVFTIIRQWWWRG